jgi:cytidine deaminase
MKSLVLKKAYFGHNHYINYSDCIHSEQDAINRYLKLSKKYNKRVDILNIKTSIDGKLMNSKPCKHCVLRMIESKIKIRYVLYSDSEGEIIMTTLKELYLEVQTNENYHVSRGS